MKKLINFLMAAACVLSTAHAGSKHSAASKFPSYEGRVMAGYQGWFRAPEDGSGGGWGHYGVHGKFDMNHLHVDLWPDVSEYTKTYETALKNTDGSPARVFSSWDESTVDIHFKWMKDYGIDGAFMQRFIGVTRNPEQRAKSRVILDHALKAAQANERAIAVMYDLSGLSATGDDCSSVIEDWKELVDQMKLTSRGDDQTYLYHRGKPLVAIWGLGFPDRSYNIRTIGIERLIDFLKNDREYGGCSVMLGVPTYFRELNIDCLPDPYLHQIIAKADIVLPWTPQRFSPLLHNERERFGALVKGDIAWCTERKVDYVPCVYPGFSWYNLSKLEFGGAHPLDQIPRQKGKFYWDLISTAIDSQAKMLYVAMFDEMDEATAIFKCTSDLPMGAALTDYEGMPSDHYLWLTGQGGKMLRKEIPFTKEIPARVKEVVGEPVERTK
ncbi:MAG: glycoside hydrolase family 71/99-like protein [Luteolibacter sp.]